MKSLTDLINEGTVAIDEKFVYKVNAKGKKRKKLKCPQGYEAESGRYVVHPDAWRREAEPQGR